MTAHQLPTTSTAPLTGSAAPVPADRSIVRRVWRTVLDVVHGIDAGALVAHGREVPPDHPARRRRLDHEEVERRLDVLYPRTHVGRSCLLQRPMAKDGKIVEHWDVIDPINTDLPHTNGVF